MPRTGSFRHVASLLAMLSLMAGCALAHHGVRDGSVDAPRIDVNGDAVERLDVAIDRLDVQDATDVPIAVDGTDATDGDATPCDGGASCSGVCVDLGTDPNHCGDCTIDCTSYPFVAGPAAHCTGGACDLTGACQAGHGDCDGIATNGCETDLTSSTHCGACAVTCTGATPLCASSAAAYSCVSGCTAPTPDLCNSSCVNVASDTSHCGACGMACATGPHATPLCTAATCGITCDTGYADCDRNPATGCEVDLRIDPTHCGSCANACVTAPSSTAVCAAGTCSFVCTPGHADCNLNVADGCEVTFATDAAHCGTCATSCVVPAGAVRTCAAGACGFICLSGAGDCNGSAVDGCETNLTNSTSNCGTCGTICTAAPNMVAACTASSCVSSCASGYADCDANAANGCEANLASDASNCGACGTSCGAGACSSGVCGIVCTAGTGNCDGDVTNGCETPTASDPTHCGTCATVCQARAYASTTCTSGVCGFACDVGAGDCDGAAANGCEAALSSDPSHCGACATACPARSNASTTCSSGTCGFTCNPGTSDCDGDPTNGCEAVLATDAAHCGTCATACPMRPGTTPTCTGGTCGFTCAPGTADCDGASGNGCEVTLATDTNHCGTCTTVCASRPSATTTCAGGTCGFTCNLGSADCDGNPMNGCEATLATDTNHCGTCANACPARANATVTCSGATCGFTCNAGTADCDGDPTNGCEVILATDATHCGTCATACPGRANATPTCAAGTCGFVCSAGAGDCDANAATGCETFLASDPAHCGACVTACASRPNSTATCTAGTCGLLCNPGTGDCNGGATDGCEVTFATDVSHCGACGTTCPARPSATATCASGACGFACDAGMADCDGNALNGCESALATSPAHCGTCATVCAALPNSVATCAGSVCGSTCLAGFGDCDGVPANGCESNLATDALHCGTCATSCGAGMCSSGVCGLVCAAGTGNCDGNAANGCEANTASDPTHCGTCSTSCPAVPNATTTCTSGTCGYACNAGQGDCDGSAANGCETVLTNDPTHCGTCATACPASANATATCATGVCGIACAVGYGNCDGSLANGCEATLTSDPIHCGTCATACPVRANATTTCTSGACGFVCAAGYGNCDGIATSGCEAVLAIDPTHCGTCATSCTAPANATATCAGGACGFTCAAQYGDCDGLAGNGCEAALQTDPTHCGTCATNCPLRTNATATCAAGTCGIACIAPYGNCDGNATNGCEAALQTDPTHCGTCAIACGTPANATATCASGACGFSCVGGFGNCDGNAANGCESTLASDPTHCGACAMACATPPNATATCASSLCGFSCVAGYGDCDAVAANGCEAAFATSTTSCGRCGNACAVPTNGAATCNTGVCGVTCNAGYLPSRGTCIPAATEMCTATTPTISLADGATVVLYGTTTGHSNETFGTCGGAASPDVAYSVTPTVSGRLTITTSALYDARVYVRTGCAGGELRCANVGLGVSSTGLPVTAGTAYAIFVDGNGGANGDYALELQLGLPCGDRDLDAGESCDDGNRTSGDGCSATCATEAPATDLCPLGATPTILLGRGPAWFSGSTTGTASDYVSSCVAFGGSDVVFTVQPTVSGTLRATVIQNGMWDAQVYARSNCAAGPDLACANGSAGSGAETVTIAVTAGMRYAILVDGVNGSQGNFNIVFEIAMCGDGALQIGENCDDGNLTGGDGCDATCQVEPACVMNETEANAYNTPNAVPFTCPSYIVRAAITPAGDNDFFSVALRAGQLIDARTFVTSVLAPSRADTVLEIYRSPIAMAPTTTACGGGVAITCQDDLMASGNLLSGFTYPVPADGTYVFRVIQYGGAGTIPAYRLFLGSR